MVWIPSFGEVLKILKHFGELTTHQIAVELNCQSSQLRPVLHRLKENSIIRSYKIEPKGLIKWKLSQSFEAKLIHYKSVYDMPWIQAIEEKRKAHTGFCEVCGKSHPYPHKIKSKMNYEKVKQDGVRIPKRYVWEKDGIKEQLSFNLQRQTSFFLLLYKK